MALKPDPQLILSSPDRPLFGHAQARDYVRVPPVVPPAWKGEDDDLANNAEAGGAFANDEDDDDDDGDGYGHGMHAVKHEGSGEGAGGFVRLCLYVHRMTMPGYSRCVLSERQAGNLSLLISKCMVVVSLLSDLDGTCTVTGEQRSLSMHHGAQTRQRPLM